MCLKQFKKLELTFAILKPHVVAVPRIVKDIQNRILSNGFYVIETKKDLISVKLAHKFYHEHIDKFFFNRLVTFMSSGPCYFHILARENAVQVWRTMMGPTKVFKTLYTHPDTIRGTHGLSDTRNATHGSDSLESAEKEIQVFFPDFSISACLLYVHKNGLPLSLTHIPFHVPSSPSILPYSRRCNWNKKESYEECPIGIGSNITMLSEHTVIETTEFLNFKSTHEML